MDMSDMNKLPTDQERSTVDQILDLLLDALAERETARQGEPTVAMHDAVVDLEPDVPSEPTPEPEPSPSVEETQPPTPTTAPLDKTSAVATREQFEEPLFEPFDRLIEMVDEPILETPAPPLQPRPSIAMNRTMVRLMLILLGFVALANLNFVNFAQLNQWVGASADGPTLVRSAREGMLLRANGDVRVYRMEDNKKRWVTTAEAFNFYNYRWGSVRVVDATYLEQFEEGEPIYMLASCPGSPHIYALDVGSGAFNEGNQIPREKRWVPTVEALEAQFDWSMVNGSFSCSRLRDMPNGEPMAATDKPTPFP